MIVAHDQNKQEGLDEEKGSREDVGEAQLAEFVCVDPKAESRYVACALSH